MASSSSGAGGPGMKDRQLLGRLTRVQTMLDVPEEEGPTADSEPVPSSLASIVPILRVANEIEQENPRVAYLCRFYAYEKAHMLDPDSTGRGVKQFKTYLIHRLEKDEIETEPTLARTDPREMQKFYQHYYEKYLREGSVKRSPDEMAMHYQIASILYDVLKAVVPDGRIEAQVQNYARDVESVERKKPHFTFQGDNMEEKEMEEKEMDPTGITRIVKIIIYHEDSFYGLTVYFERNGTTQCTGRWGGNDHCGATEVNLQTNEYITSVNGYVGHYDDGACFVSSLVLQTNLNVFGPYGNERGEYFELSVPLGVRGQIVGFHAYCRKDEVNALGVYVRQSNGTIIKKEPFLGRGGIEKYMDLTGITRIVKISIYHSDKIHALTVYFERNGITQCTNQWGGHRGKLTEINLKTNEYIKSIKGYSLDSTYRSYLMSLVLETNLHVYGPYGKERGEFFKHTSPLHCQIIGLCAMVGSDHIFRVRVNFGQIPKALISKSMPCGGSGGIARDMNPTFADYHIEKVTIRHGDTIDALSVCYTLEDGNTGHTPLWGGETGELTEINLEYGEYIKSVRGYVGYFGDLFIVRSLQLITNKESYGPYGKEEGTPFDLSAFDGKIRGFHGRSGVYLDAIGVYVQWPERRRMRRILE